MKKEFKISDRVQITEFEEDYRLVGEKGVIVAIDEDGDPLLKMDNNVDTYSYCKFNDYKSERNDLVNITYGFKCEIKHI